MKDIYSSVLFINKVVSKGWLFLEHTCVTDIKGSNLEFANYHTLSTKVIVYHHIKLVAECSAFWKIQSLSLWPCLIIIHEATQMLHRTVCVVTIHHHSMSRAELGIAVQKIQNNCFWGSEPHDLDLDGSNLIFFYNRYILQYTTFSS